MKIMITGGTGFIGRYLTKTLLANDHDITLVGRSKSRIARLFSDNVTGLTWPELTKSNLATQDIIIHLAGHNIGEKRWSKGVKQQIISSRVNSTTAIAQFCAELADQSPRILSASAVGIYGLERNYLDQPIPVDEAWEIPFGNTPDFLSQVGQEWESAWQPAINQNISLTLMRFGVVLHPNEGMLKKLLPSVKLGLAGQLGSGKQWLSWIHINDLVRAILLLINNANITGPINLTNPNPIQQRDFIKALAKYYRRPCFLKLPVWMVNGLFGEMGKELLLGGQQVTPSKLAAQHFDFTVNTIEQALATK